MRGSNADDGTQAIADRGAEPGEATGSTRGQFTIEARRVLELAEGWVGEGDGAIGAEHLVLGLLDDPGHLLADGLEAVTGLESGSARAAVQAALGYRAGPRRLAGDGPRDHAEEAAAVLRAAALLARDTGASAVAPAHLALALVDDLPPRLEASLGLSRLDGSLGRLQAVLARAVVAAAVDHRADSAAHAAPWLPPFLPSDDLTAATEAGRITPAVPMPRVAGQPDPFDRLARALHRRVGGHALITGLRGVGKTAAVRELARRAATGAIPFLKRRRFLWVDARNVAPDQSGGCLAAIFHKVGDESDVVLCLDGLGALLRGPGGTSHAAAFRTLLDGSSVRVVGLLNRWEYVDLVSGDPEALEPFTRVDLEEPTEEVAEVIAYRAALELAGDYDLEIGREVARKAVTLSSSFLLGERLPAKAVKILRRACDELDYERAQLGRARRGVTEGDIVRVVGDLTGLSEATLAGEGGDADLETALTMAVVGQADAVRVVADELALIKAGLAEPGKPASVLLFAGMTGVGKTELAKRLAELYSTSKRLQTYSMGNYLESHTVSGIIGVPPGYVGHEAGGRLINELNADPHAVFLLDEAEKCHPNVWKPFLNLFDEGWIVDAKGVKAHADRAIFILTTNAGDDAIAQMSRTGSTDEAIEAHVKSTLARVRQERSGQPVFPPQFLARIKRVVIFRPLDEGAMIAIATKIVARVAAVWAQRRDKDLAVAADLVAWIGRLSFRLNEASGGKEGGRIVRKLVAELIEGPVQRAAARQAVEYNRARTITVRAAEPEPEPIAATATATETANPAEPDLMTRPTLIIEFGPDPAPDAASPAG